MQSNDGNKWWTNFPKNEEIQEKESNLKICGKYEFQVVMVSAVLVARVLGSINLHPVFISSM